MGHGWRPCPLLPVLYMEHLVLSCQLRILFAPFMGGEYNMEMCKKTELTHTLKNKLMFISNW
ncbi:unnamed protein product [Prunus armeniaca]